MRIRRGESRCLSRVNELTTSQREKRRRALEQGTRGYWNRYGKDDEDNKRNLLDCVHCRNRGKTKISKSLDLVSAEESR